MQKVKWILLNSLIKKSHRRPWTVFKPKKQSEISFSTASRPNNMRFIQFSIGNRQSIGLEKNVGGDIIDLCAADPNIPNRMVGFIEQGTAALESAKKIFEKGGHTIPRSKVQIQAPISHPDKVICVGLNYADHVVEIGYSLEDANSQTLDWEVEVAFVMAKKARNVEASAAFDYVFGYTVALDVTAREYVNKQFNGGQVLIAKSMDTFCPIGPVLVTKDEIEDPHNLDIKCTVNGVVKQNGNTNKMIHTYEAIVAYVSKFFTLLPGDVILTGTPPGTAASHKPLQFLKRGDVVECEVPTIGKLKNKII